MEESKKSFWLGSNIFGFLCIIISLPIGSKYALKAIQLSMEVRNILTILLCYAVAFIMFFLSVIGLALFVTNLLYKDFSTFDLVFHYTI